MKMKLDNVEIHYCEYGDSKKQPILFLHGWGQNIAMMKPLADAFIETNHIFILDLPGYGDSSEPKTPWMVIDYVECIFHFCEKLEIQNPILVGHSFGGKISLLYATEHPVKKLILLACPFKKEIQKLSFKTRTLKTLKKIPGLNKLEEFAKQHIGSTDYRSASPIMRKILVNTVNDDLTKNVSKITCPTILIWGSMDEAVPVERAYELEQLIQDAGVIVYDGATHYAYLERLNQTQKVIHSFIDEE